LLLSLLGWEILIFIVKISRKFSTCARAASRAADSMRSVLERASREFHPPNVPQKAFCPPGSLSAFSPGGVESHKIKSLSVSSAQSRTLPRAHLFWLSAIFKAAFRDKNNDQNKQISP
jgi:hypothetical protein